MLIKERCICCAVIGAVPVFIRALDADWHGVTMGHAIYV
jgi:hypothetical protein